MKTTICILLFAGLAAGALQGQGFTYYWEHQYGQEGIFLSGAVLAGTEDNASAIYNPAGIALVPARGLSLSFLAAGANTLEIENVIGNGLDIETNAVFIQPKFIAFDVANPDKKEHRLVFFIYHQSFPVIRTATREVAPNDENPDILDVTNFTLDNNFSDVVPGIAFAKSINEHWHWGVSGLIPVRTHTSALSLSIEGQPAENPNTIVSSEVIDYSYHYFQVTLRLKGGLIYTPSPDFRLGLTLTTPGLLRAFDGGSFRYRFASIDADNQAIQENLNPETEAEVKYPVSIGGGIQYGKNNWRIYGSVEHFRTIDNYVVLRDSRDPYLGQAPGFEPMPQDIYTGANAVTNFAVGFSYRLPSSVRLMAGFQSDQSYFKRRGEEEPINLVSTPWNKNYISAGATFTIGKNQFALGGRFGFSNQDNIDSYGALFPNVLPDGQENTAEVKFRSFNLALTYNFSSPNATN